MKLSVISSCSRDGSRPDCSSSCSRRSISCGWPKLGAGEVDRQRAERRVQLLPFAHLLAGVFQHPVAEGQDQAAILGEGMKRSGEISPNSGWYQRTSASAPTSKPLSRLSLGW